MPVEIRELIIRTEVNTQSKKQSAGLDKAQTAKLKKELADEMTRKLNKKFANDSFNR